MIGAARSGRGPAPGARPVGHCPVGLPRFFRSACAGGPIACRLPALAFEEEKRHALTLLRGIELGEMSAAESNAALQDADPTLVYFIFKYLKKHYHRDHDMHEVVRARLGDVRNNYRALTRRAKSGEEDPVVEWFEGTHRYSELTSTEFIDIIVDKLEG